MERDLPPISQKQRMNILIFTFIYTLGVIYVSYIITYTYHTWWC